MENEELKVGVSSQHLPSVDSGEYNLDAHLVNDLNSGERTEVNFHVQGNNIEIPAHEILLTYPPVGGRGNYCGAFPHVQFYRSSLPWEYQFSVKKRRAPYLFIVLLNEEEIKSDRLEVMEVNSERMDGSLEQGEKKLKLIRFEDSSFLPPMDLVEHLAHVRVQEQLNDPEGKIPMYSSILISHRMVSPKTQYTGYVCYLAAQDGERFRRMESSEPMGENPLCAVLWEWTFFSLEDQIFQINRNNLGHHPLDWTGLEDSPVLDLLGLIRMAKDRAVNEIPYFRLLEQIDSNLEFTKKKKELESRLLKKARTFRKLKPYEKYPKQLYSDNELYEGLFEEPLMREQLNPESYSLSLGTLENRIEMENNQILGFLAVEGRTLKGMLMGLNFGPFKLDRSSDNLSKEILNILEMGKVPVKHRLRAGGNLLSWYSGPFGNWNSKVLFSEFAGGTSEVSDYVIPLGDFVPEHGDQMILFQEESKMLDMSYSAAWQLGRLTVMGDPKILQEIKKWKSALSLKNLMEEQNNTSHLMPVPDGGIPVGLSQELVDFVLGFLEFRTFPLNYLFPNNKLAVPESCSYFKLDNAWVLSFLFGMFSSGPALELEEFERYVLQDERILRVFDRNRSYFGIILNSTAIKYWPHLRIEFKNQHRTLDSVCQSTFNDSLRLYLTEDRFDLVEMSISNENAHFGLDYKQEWSTREIRIDSMDNRCHIDDREFTLDQLSIELLYRQPKVRFHIDSR